MEATGRFGKQSGRRERHFSLFITASKQPYRAAGRLKRSVSFMEATGRFGRRHSGRKEFYFLEISFRAILLDQKEERAK